MDQSIPHTIRFDFENETTGSNPGPFVQSNFDTTSRDITDRVTNGFCTLDTVRFGEAKPDTVGPVNIEFR